MCHGFFGGVCVCVCVCVWGGGGGEGGHFTTFQKGFI